MVRTPLPASAGDFTPSDPKHRNTWATVFQMAPEPKTELARYRVLSPTAGVRVSPLCLGAMSLGDQWTGFMGGSLDLKQSFEFLDYFYQAGGNFIDVANNYQDEQSEMILGEWMESREIRDEIVLATKYTTYALDRKEGKFQGIGANYNGNSRKNLAITVESSLKKLRTNYIDLLYVHWWDYSTSVEEVMQSLNDLVKSGKVLYLGISDTPAWIVARANDYARQHGLVQFSVYQGAWNLSMRDMERDIIPMCRAYGMSIAPWGSLGQGKFKTPEELEARANSLRGSAPPTERDLKAAQVLKEVADEIGEGVKLPNVALAWARQTVADCFPIIGGTSIENLKSNIDALKIHLTDAQIEKLNNAVEFDWGFPYNAFGRDPHYLPGGAPQSLITGMAGHFKFTQLP
ncbi:hypothetical protein CI109_105363 [Kwoniella shandongensis]|uniref:NADP-dependent oxidoreductase domain-containing protein n=1 Tax=Kwoniella shandongensis TaxID=1734106 RepID=A0A5M6BTL6_9TREE|nr:uncharacterized protein CI109_006342 [Kwoniella shandongensis]KAA5525362.1 hypothetical protein CI109_006342 [Kwoniella shandongensis]